MTDDRTRRSGGDTGRTFTKKIWARRLRRLAPFVLSTAQVRLRGRTTFTPFTPRKTGSRRRVGQRKGNRTFALLARLPSDCASDVGGLRPPVAPVFAGL